MSLYDVDFFRWTEETAQQLREGKAERADLLLVAEEIEEMGKRDRRAVISRAAVLMAHLLKWKYQPAKRSRSWQLTIDLQRLELEAILGDSPSFRAYLEDNWDGLVYARAKLRAAKETGIEEYPAVPPFTVAQALGGG